MKTKRRTCSIDGCDGIHEARGLCEKHYWRWRMHGDANKVIIEHPRVIRDGKLQCSKCGERKPIDEFPTDRRKAYGLDSRCKECVRHKQLTYYYNNREEELDSNKRYHKTPRGREAHKRQRNNFMHKYANSVDVWSKVRAAIQQGKLVKPDRCTDCGKMARIQGHHPDYSKPLEVVWLCQSCHIIRHGGLPLSLSLAAPTQPMKGNL